MEDYNNFKRNNFTINDRSYEPVNGGISIKNYQKDVGTSEMLMADGSIQRDVFIILEKYAYSVDLVCSPDDVFYLKELDGEDVVVACNLDNINFSGTFYMSLGEISIKKYYTEISLSLTPQPE